eukprot:209969-Chlamydomonas_euryale.AAC.1
MELLGGISRYECISGAALNMQNLAANLSMRSTWNSLELAKSSTRAKGKECAEGNLLHSCAWCEVARGGAGLAQGWEKRVGRRVGTGLGGEEVGGRRKGFGCEGDISLFSPSHARTCGAAGV